MTNNEKAPKKRRKTTFSSVLILLLLIGVGAFGIFRLRVKWKLNAAMEAIRAAGYPVTCTELDAWYTIPRDAENAAQTILDAFACFKEWDKTDLEALPLVGRAELPSRTESLPDNMKKLITEYIADNNEALELLHAAAKIEHCRYPTDYRAGYQAQLPPFSNLRRGCQLLNIEALLQAENGRADSAIHSVTSSFGLTRSLVNEPSLISQLVRVACQALTVSTIERIVNRIDLSDEQLIELSELLYEAEQDCDMSRAFVGERCMGLDFFTTPQAFGQDFIPGIPPRPILGLLKAVGFIDMDAAIYLNIMNDYVEAARLPYDERQKAADTVNARIESMSKIHISARELTPALARIITIELRAVAKLRAARTGLALYRYRRAAGTLSDNLAELVPAYLDAVPKDPFDGNDLQYAKRGAGFVVYSIGEDGSDDGGAEQLPRSKRPKGQPPPNWDVTFIVEK